MNDYPSIVWQNLMKTSGKFNNQARLSAHVLPGLATGAMIGNWDLKYELLLKKRSASQLALGLEFTKYSQIDFGMKDTPPLKTIQASKKIGPLHDLRLT